MHFKILPISYGYSWIHDVEILKLSVAKHYEVHFFIKPAKKKPDWYFNIYCKSFTF